MMEITWWQLLAYLLIVYGLGAGRRKENRKLLKRLIDRLGRM